MGILGAFFGYGAALAGFFLIRYGIQQIEALEK